MNKSGTFDEDNEMKDSLRQCNVWHTCHLTSSRSLGPRKLWLTLTRVNRIISFSCFSREKEIGQLLEEDSLQELTAVTAEAM